VKHKWLETINTRKDLGCKMTNPKYRKKAVQEELVI
jgi:hypothetical protein